MCILTVFRANPAWDTTPQQQDHGSSAPSTDSRRSSQQFKEWEKTADVDNLTGGTKLFMCGPKLITLYS